MLRSKSPILHRLSTPRSTELSGARSPRVKQAAIASMLMVAGTFYVVLPVPDAQANIWWLNTNEYKECAADLVGLDLTDEAIADACAAALEPDELSACVTRISRETTVTAATALAGCKRDRRPEDLAVCVVDIDRETGGEYADAALDYCRRSLLPLAYSDCVTGLYEEIDSLEPLPTLDVCIAADDRPVEYLPDFVYPGPPIEIPQMTTSPFVPERVAPSTTITPMQPAPAPAEPVPALF